MRQNATAKLFLHACAYTVFQTEVSSEEFVSHLEFMVKISTELNFDWSVTVTHRESSCLDDGIRPAMVLPTPAS